jgi:hypothetical protein
MASRTPGAEKLALENPFPQDARIVFYEESHTYYVDGKLVPVSTTGVTGPAFNPVAFDGPAIVAKNFAAWRRYPPRDYAALFASGKCDADVQQGILDLWATAGPLGTAMHEWIELFLNGVQTAPNTRETEQFCEWCEGNIYEPVRTELNLFYEDDGVKCAGQADALMKDGDEYVLMDWKRVKASKSVQPSARAFANAHHPLIAHIPATDYHKFSLQLSFYAVMLEQTHGIVANRFEVLRMHEDLACAEHVIAADYRVEARALLNALRG